MSDRFAGRGMLYGLAGGAMVGGVWGFFSLKDGGPAMAFGGAMLGSIPGLLVGLVIGLVLAFAAWVRGKK